MRRRLLHRIVMTARSLERLTSGPALLGLGLLVTVAGRQAGVFWSLSALLWVILGAATLLMCDVRAVTDRRDPVHDDPRGLGEACDATWGMGLGALALSLGLAFSTRSIPLGMVWNIRVTVAVIGSVYSIMVLQVRLVPLRQAVSDYELNAEPWVAARTVLDLRGPAFAGAWRGLRDTHLRSAVWVLSQAGADQMASLSTSDIVPLLTSSEPSVRTAGVMASGSVSLEWVRGVLRGRASTASSLRQAA